jgi:hypothetical protein
LEVRNMAGTALRRSGMLLGLCASAMGCRSGGVDWSNHISFRATGPDLHLSQIDPRELVRGRVSRNLHYVSIALDAVFFRNLPGSSGDPEDFVFGVEIQGALPDGRVVKTVSDVRRTAGSNAFLSFDHLMLLEPFLYTGQNITLHLHFRRATPAEAMSIRSRLAGAGSLVRKLNPTAIQALESARQLFAGIIGAVDGRHRAWAYSFTLHPSDGVIRDKPDMLFTAARHILLTTPPPSAPEALRRIRPQQFVQGLKLRGNRLVWKDTEEEYTLTPYIILNITRYKRYPRPDTELRKLVAELRNHIESKNLVMARRLLPALGAAIARDPVITSTEKNLERAWAELWEARIGAMAAAEASDKAAELGHIARELRLLLKIKAQFRPILEPFELKDITFELGRRRDEAEERAREVGEAPLREVREALRRDEENEKRYAAREREEQEAALKRFTGTSTPVVPPSDFLAKAPRRLDVGVSRDGWYRKWWFWTLVGVVVGAGAGSAALLSRHEGGNGLVVGR